MTDYVTSPQLGSRPIQLLGVDPFAEAPFRSYLASPGSGGAEERRSGGADPGVVWRVDQLVAFLTRPGAVLISEGLAAEYGLAVGRYGGAGCRWPRSRPASSWACCAPAMR